MPDNLTPLIKVLRLTCSSDHAFTVYTERIADWWPVTSHSLGGDGSKVAIEPRVGGRIYEMAADGTQYVWGTLSVWEPKRRIVHSWAVGRMDSLGTEVEVTFIANDDAGKKGGCMVRLEHRFWEREPDGAQRRENYLSGWDLVLAPFAGMADAAAVGAVGAVGAVVPDRAAADHQ